MLVFTGLEHEGATMIAIRVLHAPPSLAAPFLRVHLGAGLALLLPRTFRRLRQTDSSGVESRVVRSQNGSWMQLPALSALIGPRSRRMITRSFALLKVRGYRIRFTLACLHSLSVPLRSESNESQPRLFGNRTMEPRRAFKLGLFCYSFYCNPINGRQLHRVPRKSVLGSFPERKHHVRYTERLP
jgi:hypothetical protein